MVGPSAHWRHTPCLASLLAVGIGVVNVAASNCVDYRDYLHVARFVPIDGGTRDIAIANGLAYITGASIGFQIWDVSDPTAPSLRGSVDASGSARVVVAGDLAFLTGPGLEVVDISDPTDPRVVGSLSLPDIAGRAAVAGDILYVADGFAGLRLVDVSDPTQPAVSDSVVTFTTTSDVAVVGPYAYVTSNFGMHVVDVSDAANPVLLATSNDVQDGRIVAMGGYAYVPGFQGLQVVDLGNPLDAHVVRTVGSARGGSLAITGGFAYVGSWGGLQILDLSDAANPVLLGSLIGAGLGTGGVAPTGAAVFVSTDVGLNVIDVSNPASAPLAGSLSANVSDVAVVGTLAYLVEGATLRVYDVIDVSSPVSVGAVDMPAGGSSVAVSADHAFVGVGSASPGLQAIDVSDPAMPTLSDALPMSGQPFDVATVGGHAYVVDGTRLHVVDVSDPLDLALVGGVDAPAGAIRVVAFGDYAYVVGGGSLQVVDVSDPANPGVVGQTDPGPSGMADVAVAGGLVYGVGSMGGFQVIDVTDAAHPVAVGTVTQFPSASAVTAAGHYAYVGLDGVEVIDVSDPAHPVGIAHVPMAGPFSPSNLAYAGPHVFAAMGEAGLQAVGRQCETSVPTLLTSFRVRPVDAVVLASWQVARDGESDEFRLSARRGEFGWNVPFAETSPGRFEAEDRSAHLFEGGRVSYRLDHRAAAGQWEMLAEEAVELQASTRLRLLSPHPNPFNPRATVAFTVDRARQLRLAVCDARGRELIVLAAGVFDPGTHTVIWDGTDSAGKPVAAGAYIVQLDSEGARYATKVTMVK